MRCERIRVRYPVIVEGRYDKSTLAQVIDAPIITTGGFAIFNSAEKQSLIRRLAERGGIILLTDSDGGGRQIRSFVAGIVPREKLHQLYIPEVRGKERRKAAPSKAGFLGVEGMEREVLERLFAPFAITTDGVSNNSAKSGDEMITKLDFFEDGLSGGRDAAAKRDLLAAHFELPRGMSAGALVEALNLLASREEYRVAMDALFPSEENEK